LKYFALLLFFVYSLLAGTYDDAYELDNKKDNQKTTLDTFMYGDFKEIIRFDMLRFDDGELLEEKSTNSDITKFKEITNTIKEYIANDENISVTIIGHTNEFIKSDNSLNLSKDYAKKVQSLFLDNNISKNITILEYRANKDLAFIDETQDNKLSNRVMVTMYVFMPPEISEAVIDTPNEEACVNDMDCDGVFNNKDVCPTTPPTVEVDVLGCALSKNLPIHFASKEYIIDPYSYKHIKEFALFLKENPTYTIEIIGYTDNIGTIEDNMVLSRNRAISTKEALVSEGIDPSRLTTDARSEFDPVKPNDTKENRQANRRIEVRLFCNIEESK